MKEWGAVKRENEFKNINDDDSIKADFGYNILHERYNTCIKCRSRETLRVKRLIDEASASNSIMKNCYRCYKTNRWRSSCVQMVSHTMLVTRV
jgi:hypothetical protein